MGTFCFYDPKRWGVEDSFRFDLAVKRMKDRQELNDSISCRCSLRDRNSCLEYKFQGFGFIQNFGEKEAKDSSSCYEFQSVFMRMSCPLNFSQILMIDSNNDSTIVKDVARLSEYAYTKICLCTEAR